MARTKRSRPVRAAQILIVAAAMGWDWLERHWRPLAYRHYLRMVRQALAMPEIRHAAAALGVTDDLREAALADADALLDEAGIAIRGFSWLWGPRDEDDDPRLAATVWRGLRIVFFLALLLGMLVLLVATLRSVSGSSDLTWSAFLSFYYRAYQWPWSSKVRIPSAVVLGLLVANVVRWVWVKRPRPAWERQVRDQVVVPYLRQRLNERAGNLGSTLSIRSAPGLTALREPGRLVARGVIDRTRDLMDDLEAGAIAVAGPRGSGKTTLLRAVGDPALAVGRPTELRVLVSAPVDYQAYDFVLHLYLRLCETVLAAAGGLTWPYRAARWLRGRWLAAVALVGGLALAGWQLYRPVTALPVVSPRLVLMVAGAVLAVVGLVGLVARHGGDGSRYGGESRRSMADQARRRLEQLRFLRTYTSGGEAGVAGPAGLSLSHSRSRQVAEQRLTLPELVASYRDFTEAAADWWVRTRYGRRIVVCVDEVDRIAEPARVERFVNDVKAMFGTGNCLYLVSVSEEALSVLDRRAVGARTALDSTFDEVVRVGPVDLAATVELLQRRVVGIPYPFLLLCHCLAGGLPRDLIRAARAVLAASRTGPGDAGSELSAVAARVALADGARSTRGMLSRLVSLPPGPEVDALLGVLDEAGWPGRTAGEITTALDDLPTPTDPELAALVDQLTGAWCFTAVLLDVFVTRGREVVELFGEPVDPPPDAGPDGWLERDPPPGTLFRYGGLVYEADEVGVYVADEPVWQRLGASGPFAADWAEAARRRRRAVDRPPLPSLEPADAVARPLVRARALLAVSPSLARTRLARFRAAIDGRPLTAAAELSATRLVSPVPPV